MNLFCFGFGQVARNFIKKLDNKNINYVLNTTNREETKYIDTNNKKFLSYKLNEDGYDDTYILDGMRWLFQRAGDEQLDEDTPFAGEFETWVQEIENNRIQQNEEVDRRMNLVLSKLEEIGTLTFVDVVRALLYEKNNSFIFSTKAYNYNKKVHSTINSVLERVGI